MFKSRVAAKVYKAVKYEPDVQYSYYRKYVFKFVKRFLFWFTSCRCMYSRMVPLIHVLNRLVNEQYQLLEKLLTKNICFPKSLSFRGRSRVLENLLSEVG
jgi:hypothetical protein